MKIYQLGRFICGVQVAKDAFFDITQMTGTRYTFPLAFGWMREPIPKPSDNLGQSLLEDDDEAFTAVTCFLGPLSIAVGYIKP